MMRPVSLVLVLAAAVGAFAVDEEHGVLFTGETRFGKVWANVSLSRQRVSEPYLPIAVGILNSHAEPVDVNRESIWLQDLNGLVYTMPTVRELRRGYSRMAADSRTASFAGVPWEVWRKSRRLERSNFFPNMRGTRGNTLRDRLTLRQGHAMADLIYFDRPQGLTLDTPFFFVVHASGWEAPIRLRIVLS